MLKRAAQLDMDGEDDRRARSPFLQDRRSRLQSRVGSVVSRAEGRLRTRGRVVDGGARALDPIAVRKQFLKAAGLQDGRNVHPHRFVVRVGEQELYA